MIRRVESKTTGGHYAFQTSRSRAPFRNPMGVCCSVALESSDIVCDIGAYVGEYSMWASRTARRVYSYEPTPRTFEVLRMNRRPNMEIFDLAVVGDDRERAELFLSEGVGATNSIAKSKSKSISVGAIRYERALRDATVVKIDVEGAEYSYDIIQPQLRAILLEFHPMAGKPWETWARRIMGDLERAGFRPSVEIPEFRHGWDLAGGWIRVGSARNTD